MTNHIDNLRSKLVSLRHDERELVEAQEKLAAELAAVRAEVERTRKLLITDASSSLRLKAVEHTESARGTIARLAQFTMSEAMAELGWDRARVKKLLDAMMCEKPPTVVPDGKVGTAKCYRYDGPPVEQADPVAEREAATLEAVREWVVQQADRGEYTPAQVAAAVDVPRATALRALRTLAGIDVVQDVGPTEDMPIFTTIIDTGAAPDVAIEPPPVLPAPEPEVLSLIPDVQRMVDAARAAGCEVQASNGNGYLAVETLDGRRVSIAAKPKGRSEILQDKARLRRVGVEV